MLRPCPSERKGDSKNHPLPFALTRNRPSRRFTLIRECEGRALSDLLLRSAVDLRIGPTLLIHGRQCVVSVICAAAGICIDHRRRLRSRWLLGRLIRRALVTEVG